MPHTKAKKPMSTSILEKADAIINGDREKTYGDPGRNIRCIADFWNLYLNQKYDRNIHIKPEDVCAMMRFLKEARLINSPHDEDTLMDIAGYVGLAERIRIPKVLHAAGRAFERSEHMPVDNDDQREFPERRKAHRDSPETEEEQIARMRREIEAKERSYLVDNPHPTREELESRGE